MFVKRYIVDKAAENRSENRYAANMPSQGKGYTCDCERMFRQPVTLRGIQDSAGNHQPANC